MKHQSSNVKSIQAPVKFVALAMSLVVFLMTCQSLALSCRKLWSETGIFDYDSFLLSPDSHAQWVNLQQARVINTAKTLPTYKWIEDQILELRRSGADFKTFEAGNWSVKISDQGIGPYNPIRVVLGKPDGSFVEILSANEFKRNNSVIPVVSSFSPNQKYLAVGLSKFGSISQYEYRIYDLQAQKFIDGIVVNADASSIQWQSDTDFFVRRYGPEKSRPRFHVQITNDKIQQSLLNAPVSSLKRITEDGLFYYQIFGSKNIVRLTDVKPQSDKSVDVKEWKDVSSIVGWYGDRVWQIHSGEQGNSKNRWVSVVNLKNPDHYGKIPVEESEFYVETVKVVKDQSTQKPLVAVYSYFGFQKKILVFDIDGNPVANFLIPKGCSVDSDLDGIVVDLTNSRVQLALKSDFRRSTAWSYFYKEDRWARGDGSLSGTIDSIMFTVGAHQYVTEEVVYKSYDGQEIPMILSRRADIKPDGTNPLLLDGYGGYGAVSHTETSYALMPFQFMKKGGIIAKPGLRGGGIKGPQWHDMGKGENKINSILDFIEAARYLQNSGWTSPNKTAIAGGSHGGLVVAAALVREPGLFKLALPTVGPLDLESKGILDPNTVKIQADEYGGDLGSDLQAIERIKAFSPYTNIKPAVYPMVVVFAGRQDERVNPIHSYRFAAKLMDNQMGDAPIYLLAMKNAGHNQGNSLIHDWIGVREQTVRWSIIFDQLFEE